MARQIKRSPESFTYVLQADRELSADQQTRFTLKPLTTAERHSLFERNTERIQQANGDVRLVAHTISLAREVCLEHIEAIDRFPVDRPEPWPAKSKERQAYLEQFADTDLAEIYGVLFERSWLGDDVKNSSSPEPTSSSGER